MAVGYHVRLHDALAAVQPDSADAASRWTGYVRSWTWTSPLEPRARGRGLGLVLAAVAAFTIALSN